MGPHHGRGLHFPVTAHRPAITETHRPAGCRRGKFGTADVAASADWVAAETAAAAAAAAAAGGGGGAAAGGGVVPVVAEGAAAAAGEGGTAGVLQQRRPAAAVMGSSRRLRWPSCAGAPWCAGWAPVLPAANLSHIGDRCHTSVTAGRRHTAVTLGAQRSLWEHSSHWGTQRSLGDTAVTGEHSGHSGDTAVT